MKMMGMCAVCGDGLQAPGDFEAVHAGHHGVEQHDVGQGLRGALQGGLAVGGHQHGVARFVERVVQHRQVVGHVVHDQHHVAVGAVQRLVQAAVGIGLASSIWFMAGVLSV